LARQIAFALAFVFLIGAGPSTQPATQIRQWVDQLADSDPDARTQAVAKLMALPANQLPILREVVAQAAPLLPSQKVLLHDAVVQVYLAGMPYDPAPENQPFLGVRGDTIDPELRTEGMVVIMRVPGFGAYRMLQPGDIISRIVELPEDRFTEMVKFTEAIRKCRVGQTINLIVIRNGRQIRVPVELRARPAAIGTASIDPNDPWSENADPWMKERRDAADAYWDSAFGALISDGESVS
jgi:hypothetical protein